MGTLITALGCCGIGLYLLYRAAAQAIDRMAGKNQNDFEKLVKVSYHFQDASGLLFGFGMLLVIVAAVLDKL